MFSEEKLHSKMLAIHGPASQLTSIQYWYDKVKISGIRLLSERWLGIICDFNVAVSGQQIIYDGWWNENRRFPYWSFSGGNTSIMSDFWDRNRLKAMGKETSERNSKRYYSFMRWKSYFYSNQLCESRAKYRQINFGTQAFFISLEHPWRL